MFGPVVRCGRLPFDTATAPEEIERRLDAVPNFRQENATFWNWLGPPAKQGRLTGQKAVIWNVTMEDGSVVLGNVELLPRIVALSVSSAARAERGRALLAKVLGSLVGQPLTEIQTVE